MPLKVVKWNLSELYAKMEIMKIHELEVCLSYPSIWFTCKTGIVFYRYTCRTGIVEHSNL